VYVHGRWHTTLWITVRDAPPADGLTTPLAGAASRRIRLSLGTPPASMGAHGVITARHHRAGRTGNAQAVLASVAHLSVQPSRTLALEVLLACPSSLRTPPAPAQRACLFWRVQRPLAGPHHRENACQTSPSDAGASHTFARRRTRRLLLACVRRAKHAGRCGPPQGTALRLRSMVGRLQNFQRAFFRIARVVHLLTGGHIRV
jgi:hypothetical protein